MGRGYKQYTAFTVQRTSHISESTGLSKRTRNGVVRTCISRRHCGHRTDKTRRARKTAGGNEKTSKGKSSDLEQSLRKNAASMLVSTSAENCQKRNDNTSRKMPRYTLGHPNDGDVPRRVPLRRRNGPLSPEMA